MEKLKKWLNEIFIDGLSGMALGLFSTLIIGTIIAQIGSLDVYKRQALQVIIVPFQSENIRKSRANFSVFLSDLKPGGYIRAVL